MHRVSCRVSATRLPRHRARTLFAAASCFAALAAAAQNAGPTPVPAPADQSDQPVKLAEFVVAENQANPYQASHALSTSRVAMEIQDIPQTVSVVPRELIEDTLGSRMLDVAKYVTPITESTLPFGGDRYTIRGFQVSAEFIDGTNISGADGYSMSLAPYNIERIEIIKGPNAILVPGGSPGGVMNPITKSPEGKGFGRLTLELAQYNGNGANLDLNRVLTKDGKASARLVAAFWRNDLYVKGQYRNGYMIAPSFAYQLSPDHRLIVKAEFVDNRETNLAGVPIDPSVGSNDYAVVAKGLPRNWSFGNDEDSRHRSTERVSGELLSTLGDHVTSRLYVMGDHVRRIDVGGTSAAIAGTLGSRNPFTGDYEPGKLWSVTYPDGEPTAVATSSDVAIPSTYTYLRNNGKVDLEYTEGHVKNDYAIVFDERLFHSTTITGFAANTSKVHFISYPASARSPVSGDNLDAITYEPYTWIAPTPSNSGTDKTGRQNDLQLFVYENLKLFQERLQLSGGVSRFFGELTRTDTTGTALDAKLGNTVPSYNLSDTAKSLGVTIKPVKALSFFYGYNTTGGTMPGSLSAGNNPPSLRVASGKQNEYGVKTNLANGRITASVSYFDIVQQNYPVPNSDYYTLVAQGRFEEAAALPNPLYLSLASKGWEFEGSYSLSHNLTLLANYTAYKIRQPVTDVRVRGVPDRAGAFYIDYRFTDGPLHGFGINLGVDYKSDVAGDNATGYTTSKPLPSGGTDFVPAQPSFKIAGRTLANLGFSYRAKSWTARVTITNLFDKDYIAAALSRTSAFIGEPRAVKGSVTYSF